MSDPQRVDPYLAIEAQQDELLRQLDELNARLEHTLAEVLSTRPVHAAPDER